MHLALIPDHDYKTGVCETPKEAIDSQVVLKMKYILRSSSMTIKEIAGHTHIPNASYMCRFFRKHTGLSLSEYRRAALGQQNSAATTTAK